MCPAPCRTPCRHCSPSLPLPGEWAGPTQAGPEAAPARGWSQRKEERARHSWEVWGVTDHLSPHTAISLVLCWDFLLHFYGLFVITLGLPS